MTALDTIFATSSGVPPAAIAIIRISGPLAFSIGAALASTLPRPRHASLRALRDPRDGSLLDRALVLVFPAPRTATGEDLIEFHVHGGRAVVAAVEAAIGLLAGTRRAEPGEFTRRALENGVIDLTEAEGLGDLLSAQTETQRRAALRMAEGGVRALVEDWTDRLVQVAGGVEAQLDFSDTDDVAEETIASLYEMIEVVTREIAVTLATPPVERLHDGIRVVIAGPPNSGKSTLLNAMTGRDVAIVSPISGTTRDRIEAPVLRGGVAYILTDTAGLTDTPSDTVEVMGIDLAKVAMTAADIVLWLGDDPPPDCVHIAVHTKADLASRQAPQLSEAVSVSGLTGDGIGRLWDVIVEVGSTLLPTEDSQTVNVRQRQLLGRTVYYLAAAADTTDLLLVAEEARLALRTLDAIAGRSGIEDVLDSIFANFCIGK